MKIMIERFYNRIKVKENERHDYAKEKSTKMKRRTFVELWTNTRAARRKIKLLRLFDAVEITKRCNVAGEPF